MEQKPVQDEPQASTSENVTISGNPLYQELPGSVQKIAKEIGLELDVPKEWTAKFLGNRIPAKYTENLHPYSVYLMDEKKPAVKKSKNQKRKKKKGPNELTSSQRKNLFQFKGKTGHGLKYETFVKVHELWKEYISSVMDDIKSPQDETKLLNADFHGAHFAVIAAKNPDVVHLQGIVVQETKNTFKMIDKQDKILTIPKMGTIFAFEAKGKICKLHGSAIVVASHQRSKSRIKAIRLFDI